MKKVSVFIICIFVLLDLFLFVEANEMTPVKLESPPEAFWIKNHWQDNSDLTEAAPVHWRSAKNLVKNSNNQPIKINDFGIDNLLISGSAAPSLGNMKWLKKTIGKKHPIYLIDLRQETHLYLNGLPISLFYKRDEINWGKSPKTISQEEQEWIQQIRKSGFILLNKLGKPHSGFKIPKESVNITVKEAYTEQKAAEIADLGYFRIEVPDYHPPTPKQVDQFLQIINKMPPKTWLHFHCAGGKGRTTMFMVMSDILAHSKHVRLEDIINRQAAFGGIDLFGTSPSLGSQPWKKEFHQARSDYINLFYTYVHSGASLKHSFQSWVAIQPDGPYKQILKTEAYYSN